MPTYGPPEIMFVRGEGSRLYDPAGKEYIDWLAGIAVTSLGHSHPGVAKAIAEQATTLLHVSNLFATEPQWKVARIIDELVGGPAGQVFFCNSGGEANEALIKLARKWGGRGRHVVVSAMRSFHGRTLATLAATGQPEKHEPFQPLPEGFRHVEYNNIDALEQSLDDTVAAVLLEPIQGEGGINEVDPGYFPAVRELCTERGILLMFDEVQTGLARTGAWFAYQHYGIEPDAISIAKALGNGMPIGAIWARNEVAASFKPGDHATTFGGQPMAASAALATLQIMKSIDAPSLANTVGSAIRGKLEEMNGVVSTRGRGMLIAAELDPAVLNGRTAGDVANACLHAGLVLNGVTPTALRIAPPLTITFAEIEQGMAVLNSVLNP
ncbi:MAG TPA: aspartate aminotransferase family protein [Acidimicrobiaceae bacterium]|nr:aspartate aminotransferase family protein [Acidimicrobiaceae bacterium]HAY68592.1 aspartate aminotransferase family protein [Acidimicrobiaceae bacterium]